MPPTPETGEWEPKKDAVKNKDRRGKFHPAQTAAWLMLIWVMPASRRLRYTALKPKQQYIKRTVIKNKWISSSETGRESISGILASIEKPLVTRHQKGRRRLEAQVALASVCRTSVPLWNEIKLILSMVKIRQATPSNAISV